MKKSIVAILALSIVFGGAAGVALSSHTHTADVVPPSGDSALKTADVVPPSGDYPQPATIG